MRLVFFAEGSEPPPDSRVSLTALWSGICEDLDLAPPDRVYPIDKRLLTAMDPSKPPMSGASEGLDDRIKRIHGREPFDAAIILWDLQPPWSPPAEACRWDDTRAIYKHMDARQRLPEPFRGWVYQRNQEIQRRPAPRVRPAPPRLAQGAILPLCMTPMFEDWLIQDVEALKIALGITGHRTRKRPHFSSDSMRLNPKQLVAEAIVAAYGLKPQPVVCRQVRGTWRTNQPGWTRYLTSTLARHDPVRWMGHHIAQRLKELLPPAADVG